MRRPLRILEFFGDRLEGCAVRVVAVYVPKQAAQLVPRCRIDPPVFLQAVVRSRPELLGTPTRPGHADHRHVKVTTFDHRLQRREDFLVSQITRGAEEHPGVGMRIAPRPPLFSAGSLAAAFSKCPPNW